MRIPNKRETQHVALNHSSSDIDFKNFIKKCAVKPYSFLVIDTTLSSDNHLRLRKNLFEEIFKITYNKS